ncbi:MULTISPECIES: hypothetical protein [unclassified Flavobacterium]|uniref:hypothetical protein n=1 Tax=unclassified Flavobacterium TaxID=196869 RepID=UPI0006ABB3F9|nr:MULTISPECIES: hypothetical protein [unclassified Flavobacterium]KOP37777.1 hypothetical protein AKO67_12895 [Flavobacterium sp. VMW]OWU90992.1 hypothetical protein APR43_11000 [Flavobacterium sp. NLM]
MATRNAIEAFKFSYDDLSSFNLKKVTREDLGSGAFVEVKPIIDKFSKIVLRIIPYLELLDETSIIEFSQIFEETSSVLKDIIKYDDSTFLAQKIQLKAKFEEINNRFITVWSKIVGMIHELENENQKSSIEREYSELIKQTEEDSEEIKK